MAGAGGSKLSQFGNWLVGVILSWIGKRVQEGIKDGAEQVAEKEHRDSNQRERERIEDETQKLIDQKEAAGEELTEAERDQIRREKVRQEEDLFNRRG